MMPEDELNFTVATNLGSQIYLTETVEENQTVVFPLMKFDDPKEMEEFKVVSKIIIELEYGGLYYHFVMKEKERPIIYLIAQNE